MDDNKTTYEVPETGPQEETTAQIIGTAKTPPQPLPDVMLALPLQLVLPIETVLHVLVFPLTYIMKQFPQFKEDDTMKQVLDMLKVGLEQVGLPYDDYMEWVNHCQVCPSEQSCDNGRLEDGEVCSHWNKFKLKHPTIVLRQPTQQYIPPGGGDGIVQMTDAQLQAFLAQGQPQNGGDGGKMDVLRKRHGKFRRRQK